MLIDHALLEDAVALSAAVHTHPDYDHWYGRLSDEVGGFPGLFVVVRDAALAFRAIERTVDWDGEWLDAIDLLADHLVATDETPTDADYYWLAAASIGYALAANDSTLDTPRPALEGERR